MGTYLPKTGCVLLALHLEVVQPDRNDDDKQDTPVTPHMAVQGQSHKRYLRPPLRKSVGQLLAQGRPYLSLLPTILGAQPSPANLVNIIVDAYALMLPEEWTEMKMTAFIVCVRPGSLASQDAMTYGDAWAPDSQSNICLCSDTIDGHHQGIDDRGMSEYPDEINAFGTASGVSGTSAALRLKISVRFRAKAHAPITD
ncbi:hypothetical protein KEM54_004680 [Ascosphaera aggregata]|nr:hypothetical protein KEM54_004680 [Ascosphaera aggregata]